jgi:hypothetical protein
MKSLQPTVPELKLYMQVALVVAVINNIWVRMGHSLPIKILKFWVCV